MQDKSKIDEYIAAFTSQLVRRLNAGVGIKTIVHPAETAGGVLEVLLEKGKGGEVQYLTPARTVNEALSSVKQNLVSGDLSSITFTGTNISMQGNRIVLIKGDDNAWSKNSAATDLNRIFHLTEGSER